MRFLMLVCRDESITFSDDDRRTIGPQVGAWVEEMQARGIRLHGDVLAPPDQTTTVSVRHGSTEVVRGPREPTGIPASGFNLIECADVDEAVAVCSEHPIARFGVIELRPVPSDD